MKLSGWQVISSLFLAALLCVPAWAADTDTSSASATDTYSTLPGTLNYVEGQAQFNSNVLNSKSVGETLENGQTLSTERGHAELVLTPGVYLRAGDNSSLKMDDNSISNTSLRLLHGHLMVDVTEYHKQNDIRVKEGNATARLLSKGLYDFDLNDQQVRVFKGKAVVYEGDQHVMLKGGHDIALAENAPRKAQSFDESKLESGSLYRWNHLRSTYMAESNPQYNWGWNYPYWGWGPGWGWGWGWGGWGWGGPWGWWW
jgi:FecR protein